MNLEPSTINLLLSLIAGLLGWIVQKLFSLDRKLAVVLSHCPYCPPRAPRSGLLRKALAALFVTFVLAALAGAGPTQTTIALAWDYPTNEITPDLVFKLYWSTNAAAPLSTWSCLTNIPGTNLSVRIPAFVQANFYYATASNFWGESLPSNITSTPPLPRTNLNLQISR